MLRSLCGSTHPQGDTVHWPDRLKLATTLQDGCLNAPSISSAAYTFILNLAELSLSPSLGVTSLMTKQERTADAGQDRQKERWGDKN